MMIIDSASNGPDCAMPWCFCNIDFPTGMAIRFLEYGYHLAMAVGHKFGFSSAYKVNNRGASRDIFASHIVMWSMFTGLGWCQDYRLAALLSL